MLRSQTITGSLKLERTFQIPMSNPSPHPHPSVPHLHRSKTTSGLPGAELVLGCDLQSSKRNSEGAANEGDPPRFSASSCSISPLLFTIGWDGATPHLLHPTPNPPTIPHFVRTQRCKSPTAKLSFPQTSVKAAKPLSAAPR